jgi:Fe-S cluster assembly iron-binding protein IscA
MGTTFRVTDSAAAKIAHLIATEPGAGAFRVAVNGGGCSGFQYEFGFADSPASDDLVIRATPLWWWMRCRCRFSTMPRSTGWMI